MSVPKTSAAKNSALGFWGANATTATIATVVTMKEASQFLIISRFRFSKIFFFLSE
jgi:uncharacterized membrane protein YtjA (UPF0391 family)